MDNIFNEEGNKKIMSYKIAVASSDGKVINQHFGRSKQFLIFAVTDDGEYKFLELRENTPPCNAGEHGDVQMANTVELLSDCRIVLVSQIGPGAEQKLNARGIRAYSIPDFIDKALDKLIEFERTKQPES
jgi:nitrogen fixation protein NifX